MLHIKSQEKVPSEETAVAYRYEILRPFTGKVEELPDIPILGLLQNQWPYQAGLRMTELVLWPLFVGYQFYYYEQRQLDIQDIHAIMRMVFYGQDFRIEHKLYERLDPAHKKKSDMEVQLWANAQNKDYRLPWMKRFGRWYQELQDQDPEVKAKAEELSGL